MARVTCALVKAPLMLIDVQVHRTACIYFQEKLCVFQRDGAKPHPSSFPGALLCSTRVQTHHILKTSGTSGNQK